MDLKWKILWFLLIVSVHCRDSPLRKKVCVIGAGPSGLSSLKQMSMWPDEFEPVAFERNTQIGGQWAYTDSSDIDEHGLPVHSAVYKYMRNNLIKPHQAFTDYPDLLGENRSFVKHETILEYLQNYTQHFDVNKYIRLNTLVENVRPLGENKWIVKTRDLNTKQYDKTVCDGVVVCSGIFFKPKIPNIPGIETFPGRVLHSHAFRRPEDFANQTVVILGASVSGADIGFEISSYAKTVYLSHRHDKLQYKMPPNMIQVPGVVAAEGNQFILSNGSRIIAESIVFCTGYLLDYPFLDKSVGISTDEGTYVHPLYKHIVHANRPTLGFVGLMRTLFTFPTVYHQAHYFISVLRGSVKLPSQADMLEDSKLPPGIPASKAHRLSLEKMFDYNDELAKISGAEPLSSVFRRSRMIMQYQYFDKDHLYYRDYNYVVRDDGQVDQFPINE